MSNLIDAAKRRILGHLEVCPVLSAGDLDDYLAPLGEAVETVELIDELTDKDPSGVELLFGPGANCCGPWTNWIEINFSRPGKTRLDALRAAVAEKRRLEQRDE